MAAGLEITVPNLTFDIALSEEIQIIREKRVFVGNQISLIETCSKE